MLGLDKKKEHKADDARRKERVKQAFDKRK
jgi:hypothetical protein